MDQQTLLNYIHHPQQLDSISLDELEQVATHYPYCQTAHLLIAKNYHNLKHSAYSQKLKVASAYSSDRKRLFQLINNINSITSLAAEPVISVPIEETIQIPTQITEEPEQIIPNKTLADIGFPVKEYKVGQSPAEILANRLAEIAAKNNVQPINAHFITTEESTITAPETEAVPEIEPIIISTELPAETPVFSAPIITSPVPEYPITAATIIDVIDEEPLHIPEPATVIAPVVTTGKRSFSDWLKLSNQGNKAVPEAPTEGITPKQTLQSSIIDAFIQSEPRIQPKKSASYPAVNLAWESEDDDEIVSETLAKIFAQQGNSNKAIIMYEKLSLKFPEKSSYFAPLIAHLKQQNSK